MVTKRALFIIIIIFSLLVLWIYTAFPYQGSQLHSLQPSNDNLPSIRQGNISQQQLRTIVNEDKQTESGEYTNNERLNQIQSSHGNASHNRKIEPVKLVTLINPTAEKLRTENERQKANTSERNNSTEQQETMNSTRGRVIGNEKQGKKKTNSEKNISHVQEKNMNSRLKENSLFSFHENKSSSLQESKKNSLEDNLTDRFIRNTNFDNSSFKDNITEVSKFYEATLIPSQEFGRQVLLYSAILSNSSENTKWDRLSIQGWEAKNLLHQIYSCCVLFKSGLVEVVPVSRKIGRVFPADLRSKQFICYLSHLNDYRRELPVSVTLRSNDSQAECPTRGDMYVKIEYAYEHPGEFAIFAKIIYGDISGADLLAWFEIHRRMGADKIVFYPLKLGQNTTKVLRYYQSLGVAEIVPFTVPKRDYYDANLRHLAGFNLFNNEGVALTDSLERLQGYKYIAGFDTDEYLVPTQNETLLSLFDRLFKEYPDAAGFTFGTYLYITDWKPTSKESMFTIKTYLSRTVLTKDRNKHYVLPERVSQTSAHKFVAKKPFKGYRVFEADAVIRHYRGCRRSYQGSNETCSQFRPYTDNHLYRVFKPIEKRVLRLKQQLGV